MTANLPASACCGPGHKHKKGGFDYIFWGSGGALLATVAFYYAGLSAPWFQLFAESAIALIKTMWWGVAIGLIFVGVMSKIPREYFITLIGPGGTHSGLVRAIAAGILLDLCSHGILLIAAKLYERGVSLPQIMAFLIASPWNSFSLTIILISLIGLKWTLVFIAGSCGIAFATGLIYIRLVKTGALPENPHAAPPPENFSILRDARSRLRNFRPGFSFVKDIAFSGITEGKMLVRWLLLGIIIASAVQAFIPSDDFSVWFGPTTFGLAMTLIAATVIEVCSEASAPLASVILNKAAAPGNAFAFLMAGVSTDYTEMMILRQATGSWKVALSLPLVTAPQIIVLGYIMNAFQ